MAKEKFHGQTLVETWRSKGGKFGKARDGKGKVSWPNFGGGSWSDKGKKGDAKGKKGKDKGKKGKGKTTTWLPSGMPATGKGSSSSFQGYCENCGKYGHKWRQCWQMQGVEEWPQQEEELVGEEPEAPKFVDEADEVEDWLFGGLGVTTLVEEELFPAEEDLEAERAKWSKSQRSWTRRSKTWSACGS